MTIAEIAWRGSAISDQLAEDEQEIGDIAVAE